MKKMISQKVRREKIKHPYQAEKDTSVLGRDKIMKEEKQNQENYFALRLGRRHHPRLIQHRLRLLRFCEVKKVVNEQLVKE
jgi:hypothetical protein